MARPTDDTIENRKAFMQLMNDCIDKPSIFAKTFLKMELFPKNAEYADSKERFIVYRSGRQVGKTTSTAVKTIHFAFFAPVLHERVVDICDIVIVAPTRDQANIMLDRIKTLIHRSEFLTAKVLKETVGEIHVTWMNGKGKSRIYTRAAGTEGTSVRGYCIEQNEYIYTPTGTKQLKEIEEGDEILGGTVKGVHSFEDEVYKIRFYNGTSLQVNGEHPFMTKNGWVKARDLKILDQVEFLPSEIKPTKSIGKNMAKFLGYMFSDGYAGKTSNEFYNTNSVFRDEVKSSALELFGMTTREYQNGERVCFTQKRTGMLNPMSKYFQENHLMGKDLGYITQLPNEELISFINGIFNGDGSLSYYSYIHKKTQKPSYKVEISFAMGIHKKRAIDLQFILWRLGIESFIKLHSSQNCWYVKITDKENIIKSMDILEDTKYPEKFREAKRILSTYKPLQGIYHGRWIRIRSIKDVGIKTVIGFEVNPTHEIISYLGMRTHNTPFVIIADECSFLPEQVIVSLMPAGLASKARVWLTSTPYTPTGYFYNACMNSRPRKPDGQWMEFNCKSTDNPLISADAAYLNQQKQQLTEAQYRMEIEGEFLEVGDSFIPRHLIEEAMGDPKDPPILLKFYIGVDVATEGQDETAITIIGIDREDRAHLVELHTERRSDLVQLASTIQKYIEKYNAVTAFIDETAVGKGLIDICNSQNMRIRGIVMSLEEQERLYKNLLMLFENRRIFLHGNHKIAEQLTYLKTKWTEGKKMRVVSDMPDDCADSLTLACKSLETSGRMFVLDAKHIFG